MKSINNQEGHKNRACAQMSNSDNNGTDEVMFS